MMTLSQQIKEQADTIEMLSGERPVGVRLTRAQVRQIVSELGIVYTIDKPTAGTCVIYGLRVEIIDDIR
jgi:hypothetical protein